MIKKHILLMLCYVSGVFAENSLEKFCRTELKNKKICMAINPGNAGDALIWYGTYCFLKQMRITYSTSNEPTRLLSPDIDIVIYPGGGNLVPYYGYLANFLETYMHKVKKLVIFPHTIQGHGKLLQSIPSSVMLFCREKMSYDYCQQTVLYPQTLYYAHDMAFYADIDAFKKHYGKVDIHTKKHLLTFRMDAEVHPARKSVKLPPSNIDISSLGKIRPGDSFEQCLQTAYEFLGRMMPYETIWTDRLHVAIGAFLLGKKVHLFDNIYGKNKAVYEASLKTFDILNHVSFHGADFNPLKNHIAHQRNDP